MIQLKPIRTSNATLYKYMEQLLVSSFPKEEYRPLADVRRYTDEVSSFHNNVILDGEQPVGLLTYWKFPHFYYIEHFATDPSLRNAGYGRRTLEHLCKQLDAPIVLEVERPTEEMAIRRIGFYERQGFQLWKNDYRQPPYNPGDGLLPMYIMVHGNLDSETHYEEVKNTLHREVYGVR